MGTKIIEYDAASVLGVMPGEAIRMPKEHAFVGGAYEGVDRFNRDLALWHPPLQSPDNEIIPAKPLADARGRDISRNDAYVASALRIRQDSIVGEAYFLNAKPNMLFLGDISPSFDETWETEFQEEVENKFTLWAESDKHWIDASRINTLTSMVRLAVCIHGVGGEVLAVAEWLRDLPRLYNSAVQMVDADRLSNPWGAMETSLLRGGVERNVHGAPQAYHIRMAHPNDYTNFDSYRWKRVLARKPWGREQVLHIFEQSRPDQTRGISDMVAALKAMKVTQKFRDITLQNAVLNATYAASIESELPAEQVYAALGAGNVQGNAIFDYANAFLEAIDQYAGTSRNMQIDGVKIPHLFPGTKLQLRPAGNPGGVGSDFEMSLLRYIAANLGVSYEQLSKDFSKTNYSSARAGFGETWKYMRAAKKAVADRMANFAFLLWLEEALVKNQITSIPSLSPGWQYEPMVMEALGQATWIGTGSGQIDELKETQAAVLRVKNNLTTREHEIAKLGGDYRLVFKQQAREKALMEELDIVPTEDQAMMNAATGEPDNEGAAPRGEGDERAEELSESVDRMTAAIMKAVEPREPPVVNVSVEAPQPNPVHVKLQPHITVETKTKRNGATQTEVLAHDEKGRILRTRTTPVEDGEDG